MLHSVSTEAMPILGFILLPLVLPPLGRRVALVGLHFCACAALLEPAMVAPRCLSMSTVSAGSTGAAAAGFEGWLDVFVEGVY
jgi:hypothetical protein